MSHLSAPHFHDEAAAYSWVEARLWPEGPVCPHCGVIGRGRPMKGKTTRVGLYKCYACREPFSVKIGTVFESSHVKMHVWLQAIFLLCSSKKGFSTNQFARTLGVSLKTAWFLSMRIREAMRDGKLGPLGGPGKIVESDETFYGNRKHARMTRVTLPDGSTALRGGGHANAMKIMTLVERGGKARSVHMEALTTNSSWRVLFTNVDRRSHLMTDEAPIYRGLNDAFASHNTVNHSKDEYVRGLAHVNTAEGFFSVFKRGMKGVYQHCSERHLHRYLAEFDFRYNHRVALGVNDGERAEHALAGVVGKRLYYRELA